MYKLLTTAAVIMAVATPSFAWNNAKEIIQNLDTTYNSLDGSVQFNDLQSSTGALTGLVEEANKGVTHVTLSVDPTTKLISTSTQGGTTLEQIQTASDNLINRVNYDLFTDVIGDGSTYDVGTDYGGAGRNVGVSDSVGGNGSTDYVNTYDNAGLVGKRVTSIVSDVNAFNDYLVAPNRSTDESNTLIAAISTPNGTIAGVDTQLFADNIESLNTAISTISGYTFDGDGAVDGGTFNGNLDAFAPDGSTAQNFVIQNYNSATDINQATGNDGIYTSLSAWANEIQTIDVDGAGTLYNYTGTESLVIVDANNVLVDGVSTPITDSVFTPVPLP